MMDKVTRLIYLIALDTVLEDAGETLSEEALLEMIGLESVLDGMMEKNPKVMEVLDEAVDATQLVLYAAPLLKAEIQRLVELDNRGEPVDNTNLIGSNVCEWYLEDYDSSLWVGNCGFQFVFSNDDDPNENGMDYCPSCGRKLKQKAIQSFSE